MTTLTIIAIISASILLISKVSKARTALNAYLRELNKFNHWGYHPESVKKWLFAYYDNLSLSMFLFSAIVFMLYTLVK